MSQDREQKSTILHSLFLQIKWWPVLGDKSLIFVFKFPLLLSYLESYLTELFFCLGMWDLVVLCFLPLKHSETGVYKIQ